MPRPPWIPFQTSFNCRFDTTTINQIVTNINTELQKYPKKIIDFIFIENEYKWRIDLYPQHHHIKVQIRIYKNSLQNLYLIDFHRYNGEAHFFFSLYNTIRNVFITKCVVCDNMGKNISLHAHAMTSHVLSSTDYAPSVPPGSLFCIYDMICTPFCETQKDTVRTIACLSDNFKNHPEIFKTGFITPLVTLLNSKDPDSQRCSAVTFANLAEGKTNNECLEKVAKDVVPTLCKMMACSDPSYKPTMYQREAARAIANLLGCGNSVCSITFCYKELITSFVKNSPDDTMYSHCKKALELLEMHATTHTP